MARMINEMVSNFTVVHNNFLQDPNLGIAERGLLMTMLSKPDDFDFSIKLLSSQLPNGETAVRNTLTNLERCGYLKRDRIKENGKFSDVVYRISDCPIFLDNENKEAYDEYEEKTVVEEPRVENPHSETPQLQDPQILLNTKIPNTELPKTKKTNICEHKKKYAEKVQMTEEQYSVLCTKYSKPFADKCIEELDLYKHSSGRSYKSDYHAILKWVVDNVMKKYPALAKSAEKAVAENSPDINPFDEFVGGQ